MIKDMVFLITCPSCGEENRFKTGIPKKGEEFDCPTCGEIIVINDVFIDEFNRIVEGLSDSIERFVELY